VGFRVILPGDLEWVEREPEPGGVARYVAPLSDFLGFAHTRGSMWRYPPGSKGRRHRDTIQEETFVVLSGTLTMYLGDPPERVEVPAGGVVHVESGTVLQ
jgi:quercetin dioxygenase-like cupin family protein